MELVTYLGQMVSAVCTEQRSQSQNMFVDSAGNLKLGDFGSCSSAMASLTGVQRTPLFLSPELRSWYRVNMGNTELIPDLDPFQSDVLESEERLGSN